MTTYADASAIALWGWKGWAVCALALLLTALVAWRIDAHHQPRQAPTEAPDWRCANDCGESWYVEESDELATADLALWELELDMGWAP